MNREAVPTWKKQLLVGIWEETAGIMRMLTELLPFTIWYTSLTGTQDKWTLTLGILAIILFSSFYLTRLLHHLKWNIVVQAIVILGWMLACILLGLKVLIFPGQPISFWEMAATPIVDLWTGKSIVEFVHTLLFLFLVWRGVFLTRYPTRPFGVIASFQVGLIFFIVYAFLHPLNQPKFIIGTFFAFVMTSLAGLSTSRIAEQSEIEEARLPAMSLRWAAGLIFAVTGIAAISYGLAAFINRFLADPAANILRIVIQILADIFFLITSPFLFALMWLIEKIMAVINTGVIVNLINLGQDICKLIQGFAQKPLFNLHINFRFFFWVLLFLGIVVVILISLRWKPWKRVVKAETEGDEIEPEIRFNRILNWLQKLRIPTPWINPARMLAAARIRRIYAQLLKLCKKFDRPRPPASTPLEFLPTLGILFPENLDDLKAITHSYLKVRYGAFPETRHEVEEIEKAWRHIKLSARNLQAILRIEKQRRSP
jgi:hypothetical protein